MRDLNDLSTECARHLLALQEAIGRCPQPLTVDHFAHRDAVLIATLDQFAYRFSKLQDVMSAQVFRRFAVDRLKEPVEDRPIIDILNLLERYGHLPSVTRPALRAAVAGAPVTAGWAGLIWSTCVRPSR